MRSAEEERNSKLTTIKYFISLKARGPIKKEPTTNRVWWVVTLSDHFILQISIAQSELGLLNPDILNVVPHGYVEDKEITLSKLLHLRY